VSEAAGPGGFALRSPFVFVSGNAGKIAEARLASGLPIEAVEIDLPEMQSLDVGEILTAKAEEAFRRLGRPVVVEETSLELPALNGFPGPLVKWMLEAVGAEGIARTAQLLGDPRAKAVCLLAYKAEGLDFVARGEVEGTLVLPPRGAGGFGWDPVFLPDGETRTFGEMTAAEKIEKGHRGRAWRHFLELLPRIEEE
jgi:non-canonical purine NTP pyrophosphatase (RdgB/HAM1 family)